MPTILRYLLVILLLSPLTLLAETDQPFTRTEDGVIIYPKEELSGNTQAIRLQVITDKIIRVIASPRKEVQPANSLITIYKNNSLPKWNLVQGEDKQQVTLKTDFLTAIADLSTGTVVFYDADGKKIFAEKRMGRQFEQTVAEGERTYAISQTFETAADDAWYGLGQHQDGLMNYKGYQVFLFQNNTEVAVPFLISRKNYGILWDNHSITRAGDTREYKPLNTLRLLSKYGQPGWLTATYRNNNQKAGEILFEKAESDINYEFLNDSKLNLPPDFTPASGSITWEGSLASMLDGDHKLRFTYGGYLKVWLDGMMVLDRWRQSWMPGSAILDVSMLKDKPVGIKIEWIPNGGESYVSLKWQEPVSAKDENSFGFASEAGQQMDYYFIHGNNMDEVISGYRTLTGKATLLPIWSYGFWQSRERYKTQGEILETVKEFRKRKIPLDNIVLDWSYWKQNDWGSQEFDATRFSNPDSMIKVIHDQYKTRFMISVWPKFYEGIETYREFEKAGWLYKRNIADRQRDWIAQGYVSTFYDAFNEGAQKGFWKLLDTRLYRKGIDAWWMDASEPDILSNVSPAKRKLQMYPLSAGLTSEYMNAYPLVNAKGIYEGQRSVDPDKRVFILTRSGYPGLQRYASVTWSGDISSRWHDMKLQISAGINFSMSGIPNWTMDIGGFAVESRYENPNAKDLEEWRELNARWFQFGAFVPIFRVHGQFPYREIYNVSPEDHACYQSMLYYNKLRYRLLPYIYSLAGWTYHQDYTIMRGLVMDFPNDEKVLNVADQYMFGPSILINPIYTYGQRSRSVYLPKGQGWFDLYTGAYQDGGQQIEAPAPYDRMPIFIREGSIIPYGPALQYSTEKKADTITLYVYGGKDASFKLYEDQGLNYDYEKGQFSNLMIHYTEANKQLTIEKREGKFTDMLKNRTFIIRYVTKENAKALDLEKKEGIIIKYNGNKKSVLLH